MSAENTISYDLDNPSKESISDLDLDGFTTDLLFSVTFDDLDSSYFPGCDICVTYRLDRGFKPSSRDWVGLYKTTWKSPQQYVSFEWAPKHPKDYKFPLDRSLVFHCPDVKVDKEPTDQLYQLLYIAKNDDIIGISKKFSITEKKEGDEQVTTPEKEGKVEEEEEASFVCIERPLGKVESVPLLGTSPRKQKSLLETFEVIKSCASEESTFLTPKSNHNDKNKETRRTSDHETLLKDFNSTSRVNEADRLATLFDFTSTVVRQYDTNNERSLIPVANTERSLVPYSKKVPLPIYSIAASQQGSLSAGLSNQKVSQSPVATASCRPSFGSLFSQCKPSCSECWKRLKELHQVKERCVNYGNEIDTLKNELKGAEDTLTMKSLLLDELSKQVKNLVHENATLSNTNEKFASTKSSMQSLTSENRRLHRKSNKASCTIEELQKGNTILQKQNDILDQVARMSETDNASLRERNKFLEAELKEIRTQHVELEKLLDDIMYTLSLQGYTKMVDTNGNIIDLTKKKGSVLELDGWTVALSRKTEHHLTTISKLQEMVAKVTADRDSMRERESETDQKLQSLEASIEMEKAQSKTLQEKLEAVSRQLSNLLEERDSLTATVSSQKKERRERELASRERESDLNVRIHSLENVVVAGQAIQKQGNHCDCCSIGSSTNSVSKSKSSATNTRRLETQYPVFKSPCLPGTSHRGARPKSTKELMEEGGLDADATPVKATAEGSSPTKTLLVCNEDQPTRDLSSKSVHYENELQTCFRKSLKTQSATWRSRRHTPYPQNAALPSHNTIQLQEPTSCSQDSVRAPATLSSPEGSDKSADDLSTFSLTEVCHRALSSAAMSLGSMYEACINGDMKKAIQPANKKPSTRKMSLDKAARKAKKPRKFHFKVFNPANVELPSDSTEYTPRIYGSRPRKPALVNTPRTSCPKCHRTFPPGFGQERINRHMDAHDKLGH